MIISQQEKLIRSVENQEISPNTKRLLQKLLTENPRLEKLLYESKNPNQFQQSVKRWMQEFLEKDAALKDYYLGNTHGYEPLNKLQWRDYAIIRILDYLDNSGREFTDLNLRGRKIISHPFVLLWKAVMQDTGGIHCNFVIDMIHLFRQLIRLESRKIPEPEKVQSWMDRHITGLDERIVKLREKNKERIIDVLIDKISSGQINSKRYRFDKDQTWSEKYALMNQWWNDHRFHLKFAVRDADLLNEMLGSSLNKETMNILYRAEKRGIPIFVNPYYLSLLNVDEPAYAQNADLAIRHYVIYSSQLVDEFGHIVAWEREDKVEPGKPNAAGWILPTHHNVHRRYPEVAILIPDTMGRACAGLCASCQRMYDFQRGNLNFDLDKLSPQQSWDEKLEKIMKYWENDSQLRDILITGGDALMSSDKSLKKILDAVYKSAVNKRNDNKKRPEKEKYAEFVRVRLGTRLPVYLPQRITDSLAQVLAEFKEKASKVGVRQFVIQTHFQTSTEITPESRRGVEKLISAGWMVTNQLVFTTPASRRGHTAKLRQELNKIGVLSYYTFSVKGYMENTSKFATNARAAQEQYEEKILGNVPLNNLETIRKFPTQPERMVEQINELRKKLDVPFLATDRSVLNLPGVGKSMTYRVIGITKDGRRILEFDHDPTRIHSPIINKMGKFVAIESKSIQTYLDQMKEMDENTDEYDSIWGYSIGETESRAPIYEYPEFPFKVTDNFTNFKG